MSKQTKFSKLFEPGSIGSMKIRNRIVMSPMATNYADNDGKVTDLMIDHYEQRARGGVGLIITEVICPDFPRGKTIINEAGIDDDKYIPGYRRLTEAVHKHGARIAIQLHHAGREAQQSVTGLQPVAPSPILSPSPTGHRDMPRELTADEIHGLVNQFAEAAARAKECGFDGVEIHAAHSYLVNQFISLISNKRTDAYGGDLANRARFLLEIIAAIRSKVGTDFPLWCRINTEELGPGSITLEELQSVAQMAVKAGCDAINVSIYGLRVLPDEAGALVPFAEALKKATDVPVITVGFLTPEVGEKVLAEGRADFIAMGRELLCDAELPNKAQQGRFDEITPCIQCQKCLDRVTKDQNLQCSVNATLGRGYKYPLQQASKSKKIIVAGGGPSGMEAARVAALRGHKVTLYDAGVKPGGQLLIAGIPPHKEQIKKFMDYLTNQVRKLNVKIERKLVTADLVRKLKPDAVIVATGIEAPSVPQIPGLEKIKSVFAGEVLSGRSQTGDKVVIIGGGQVGCETAEFLIEKGKKVTIVEVLPQVMTNVATLRMMNMLMRMYGEQITMLTNTICEEVSAEGVKVCSKDGQRQTIPADTVVIATGSKPDKKLYEALQGSSVELYLIGDAVQPRSVFEAIEEGFKAGMDV